MELKPIFGRPGVDVAIRCTMAVALLILAIAAAVTGDAREIAFVVGLFAFAAMNLLVLPRAVDRALTVVLWVALLAWLAVVVS